MESQRVLMIKVSVTEVPGFESLPQLQQEVLAISRNHQVTELAEPVRRRDVLRALLDNDPFDIIHFAGHLSEQGFVASEEIIPLDMIVMYVQTGHPKLVFFNTCSSEKVAEMVAGRCPADCIFTISNIDNQDAIDFATMYYSMLKAHDVVTYKDARDRVDPTGIYFRYLPGKNVVVRRGDETTQRLDALERAVGGGRLGEMGLAQRVAILETDVSSFKAWKHEEAQPILTLIQRDYSEPRRNDSKWFFLASLGVAVLIALALYAMQR